MAEYRILIADDDDDDFFILKAAFEDTQIPVTINRSKDGSEAMEFLHNKVKNNESVPDVVILDINMPQVTGIMVLNMMRSSSLFRSVPVIMYSTCGTDAKKCMSLGANGYATKGDSLTKVASFAKDVTEFLKLLKTDPGSLFKHGKTSIDK